MTALPTTPTPPRLTGNPADDSKAMVDWAWILYKNLVIETQMAQRLEAIANVSKLTQTITDPPTKTEVENIQTAVNEIIEAARALTS